MTESSSKHPNLDRITQAFVEKLEANASTPLYELSPQQARQFLLDLQRQTPIEVEADIIDNFINTKEAGEVDVRFVRPKGSQNEVLPLILYIHGGGWILGDKESHNGLITNLAKCTHSVVAFVNYSRSPEAVYPTAVNEIYGVLEYLFEHHGDFNINPDKIIVAGDSAGGNMAAVTALKAKNQNGPKILLQALLYPVTDASMSSESYKQFKDGPWLSKKAMEWFWDVYAPDKKSRECIYISPLNADIDELENLPPALVITGENDVLRDEGEEYARKLDKAGVDVFSIRINNTHHDFLMLNALWHSVPAQNAFMILCGSILNAVNGNVISGRSSDS